jgi:hypothetical protein
MLDDLIERALARGTVEPAHLPVAGTSPASSSPQTTSSKRQPGCSPPSARGSRCSADRALRPTMGLPNIWLTAPKTLVDERTAPPRCGASRRVFPMGSLVIWKLAWGSRESGPFRDLRIYTPTVDRPASGTFLKCYSNILIQIPESKYFTWPEVWSRRSASMHFHFVR